jgi:hypothetical protein
MEDFMKSSVICALLSALTFLAPAGATAKDNAPKYQIAQVKPFTLAEGVEFPPGGLNTQSFLDALYQNFGEQLQKQGVAAQVTPPETAVPDADAANAIVIEGKITAFDKRTGSMANPSLLTMQLNVYRRSDNAPLASVTQEIKMAAAWWQKSDIFGKAIGPWAVSQIKKALK